MSLADSIMGGKAPVVEEKIEESNVTYSEAPEVIPQPDLSVIENTVNENLNSIQAKPEDSLSKIAQSDVDNLAEEVCGYISEGVKKASRQSDAAQASHDSALRVMDKADEAEESATSRARTDSGTLQSPAQIGKRNIARRAAEKAGAVADVTSRNVKSAKAKVAVKKQSQKERGDFGNSAPDPTKVRVPAERGTPGAGTGRPIKRGTPSTFRKTMKQEHEEFLDYVNKLNEEDLQNIIDFLKEDCIGVGATTTGNLGTSFAGKGKKKKKKKSKKEETSDDPKSKKDPIPEAEDGSPPRDQEYVADKSTEGHTKGPYHDKVLKVIKKQRRMESVEEDPLSKILSQPFIEVRNTSLTEISCD